MPSYFDVIYLIYFRCRLSTVYNLNYTPTTLGVQSWREIVSGVTWTKRLNTTDLGFSASLTIHVFVFVSCFLYPCCLSSSTCKSVTRYSSYLAVALIAVPGCGCREEDISVSYQFKCRYDVNQVIHFEQPLPLVLATIFHRVIRLTGFTLGGLGSFPDFTCKIGREESQNIVTW
jgi:hypothetical protein